MTRIIAALGALCVPGLALGDWNSLHAEGGITAVHQRQTNGARQDTNASADLFVFLPVRSGEWTLYLEGATTTSSDSLFVLFPESNADAGTAADDQGGSRIQISELSYRWAIDERHELTLGEIDPSAHLDRSRIANDENAHFLGTSFVNNPTIEFPDYSLGLMYRINRTPTTPEITAILSSSDGLADNPGRSYQELINVADAGKGVFAGLGARWAIRDTRVGLGGWYRSDDHPKLNDSDSSMHNYGVYGIYGWQAGNHGVNFRVGAARAAVSAAEVFVGAAYEGVTRFGAVGLGAGKIYKSAQLTDPNTDDTLHVEAFFRVPLFSTGSHMTAALQYLENPGFDSSNTAVDAHVLLAALRFHIWFG
jgi:hypothetical protein